MDTARSKSGNDNNVPRRLTRSTTTKVAEATTKVAEATTKAVEATTKAVEATTNTRVDENRRVTRSMTKHLRECNSNRTGEDAGASKGQITRQIRSRTRSRNTNTRKRR